MRIALAILVAASGFAQTTVKFSPEPMAVPTAQIANARQLGRWLVEACNDGTAPVTMTAQRLSMAAPAIAFIDPDDALLVLTTAAKRSFWGSVAHYAQIGGSLAAVGLALAKGNADLTTGIGVGSSLLPGIVQLAQGQTPAVTPLVSTVKYPVTLSPGGCMDDHFFAAKLKNPAPLIVKLP